MTTPQAFEPICLIDSTQHAPAGGLFLPQAAHLGGLLLSWGAALRRNRVLKKPIGLHLGS
jgi:hypothetical protein